MAPELSLNFRQNKNPVSLSFSLQAGDSFPESFGQTRRQLQLVANDEAEHLLVAVNDDGRQDNEHREVEGELLHEDVADGVAGRDEVEDDQCRHRGHREGRDHSRLSDEFWQM